VTVAVYNRSLSRFPLMMLSDSDVLNSNQLKFIRQWVARRLKSSCNCNYNSSVMQAVWFQTLITLSSEKTWCGNCSVECLFSRQCASVLLQCWLPRCPLCRVWSRFIPRGELDDAG